MPDRQFEEPSLVVLYDLFCSSEGREDFGFYLPLVLSARSVLDVGCGTGNLLHSAREQGWDVELSGEVTNATGGVFRWKTEVQTPVEADTVSFSRTMTCSEWSQPEVSHSTLRFLDTVRLFAFLAAAGLVVEQRCGDWDRSPLTAASPEIITLARR